MAEVAVRIPIAETEMTIHGVLRGGTEQQYPSSLVIIGPGYSEHADSRLPYCASKYFESEGIPNLRLSFYGPGEDQRNIGDYNTEFNAADIDTAVSHARERGTEWVGVIGHSYSGMAVVHSKAQGFDTAVLWDPTHSGVYHLPAIREELDADYMLAPELRAYASVKGAGHIVTQTILSRERPDSIEASREFKIDTFIIGAGGNPVSRPFGEMYQAWIDAPTERIVIPDASHTFAGDVAMEALFRSTAAWIAQRMPSS